MEGRKKNGKGRVLEREGEGRMERQHECEGVDLNFVSLFWSQQVNDV